MREALSGNAFTEADLHACLGVADWRESGALGAEEMGVRVRALHGPLKVLAPLFYQGRPMDEGRVRAVLGEAAVGDMVASGMLRLDGGQVLPLLRLSPVGDLVFASDLMERHERRQGDFVLGPGGVTRFLGDALLPSAVDSVLDLGCGAGVLAGLVAARAGRVVATDINARAVAFSAFNAELNGWSQMSCREGSLFAPVAGERFDLIVCNPPYVISPGSTFVYRDGGTALCRQIVREARHHLTPDGLLQMMVEWPQRADADWRDEVREWLEDAGCDAWLLRFYAEGAEAYAQRWLAQEHEQGRVPDSESRAWTDHLRNLGVESVGGGLLVLRPARGEVPVRELRQAPPVKAPVGASLERWIACHTVLAARPDDRSLLDAVLIPSPDLERIDRRAPTGTGWTTTSTELRLGSGLMFGVRVDPVAGEIVALLDGRRTSREALLAFADGCGVPVDAFQEGFPSALRRLVALGMVVPAPPGRVPASG